MERNLKSKKKNEEEKNALFIYKWYGLDFQTVVGTAVDGVTVLETTTFTVFNLTGRKKYKITFFIIIHVLKVSFTPLTIIKIIEHDIL